jgi:hypothetical protein
MNSFHKELLLELIHTEWTDNQLDTYIFNQEQRLENAKELLRELKEIRRKRNKKKQRSLDTGVRGGS